MLITLHAQQRWSERFPDRDIEITYASANKRVGKKTRKKLREACPFNKEFAEGAFKGRYYAMTNDCIVFVMTAPETIITVFRLE